MKHVVQYSPLLADETRRRISHLPATASIKTSIPNTELPLSQLPQFLSGQFKFDVPVYAVWGACEDVQVLEKLRAQEYKIDKLHILDEAHSRLLEVGGVKLRLLGLGGALVMHKLFDNGEGRSTIAGGQGTMWTTLLQIGELVDTANRTYDPSETRVLVTHASPAREGLLNQLAVALKADFSISGGLHFRYGSSYNEFSVNPTSDHFRGKLAASRASFTDIWETVKETVEPIVAENESHQRLLNNAIDIIYKMPTAANGGNPFGGQVSGTTGSIDEAAFKNMWNFNLADAAYGWLALDIESGRIGTEMKALGFNFSHRAMATRQQIQETFKANTPMPPAPAATIAPPPYAQNIQPQASTPAAPANATGPPPSMQTRPGQQPRSASTQQPQAQPRTTQPPTGPASQTAQAPAPKAPTPSARPASQAAPPQATNPASAPTTNGTTSAAKSNGVTSPPPADSATTSTPPPHIQKEQSSGIYMVNGPTDEAEVKALFKDEDQAKIQGIESQRAQGSWHIKFGSPEEMKAAMNRLPNEYRQSYPPGEPRLHVRPFSRKPFPNRGAPSGGYKSGSDTEGGRGRGGFPRNNRGGRGGERGDRGGERGRGRGRGRGGEGGAAPASTPAVTGGSS